MKRRRILNSRSLRLLSALLVVISALGAAHVSTGSRAAAASGDVEAIGLVDSTTGRWHQRTTDGGVHSFYFGNPGDYPIAGDWDCDGVDTPGLYRQSDGYVYLSNANRSQVADIRFFFGDPGDLPLAGDFDGDGCDAVSIYRPSEGRIYVINELGSNERGLGAADYAFYFGNPGDKPFVGDFDADGIDEIGLHRESTGLVYFRYTLDSGIADHQYIYGDPDDRLVAGDWNADGKQSPAIFRPSTETCYLRHTNTQGVADETYAFGESDWLPISGEFGLTSDTVVTRVAVSPGSLLIGEPGERARVRATAYNAGGDVVDAAFAWRSADLGVATVAESGDVTAVAVGTTTVVAAVGAIASEPVQITVADLSAGAVPIPDARLASAPSVVGTPTANWVGTRLQMSLHGSDVPAVGELLVGTEESGLAGRVVGATRTAAGVDVVVEAVPLTEVFDQLDIQVSVPVSLAAARSGPAGRASTKVTAGPFDCDLEGDIDLGVTRDAGIRIEDRLTTTVDYEYKIEWDWLDSKAKVDEFKFVLGGGIDVVLTGLMEITPTGTGTATCTVDLGSVNVPVSGWLAPILTPKIKFAAGMEVGMTATADPFQAGVVGKVPVDVDLGIEWKRGVGYTIHDTLTAGTPTVTPKLELPSDLEATVDAFLFGQAELAVGSSLTDEFDASLIEARAGLQQEADVASKSTQAKDDSYRASYRLDVHATFGPGDTVSDLVDKLGSGDSGPSIEEAIPWDIKNLGTSPTGSFALGATTVKAGDQLTGTVTLDAVTYPGLGYNVKEVRVYQRNADQSLTQAGDTIVAASGQRTFAWSWTPGTSDEGPAKLASFVVTKGIPGFALQVGTAQAVTVQPGNDPPVAVADSITVLEGASTSVLDGGATSVLANDTDAEGATLTAVKVSDPAHGTLTTFGADGTFTYAHDGSETTSDSFTYKANDGAADSNVATVTISITPVNDSPVANDDVPPAPIPEGGTLQFNFWSVLDNDTDEDGVPALLTAEKVTDPAHGSVDFGSDGRFTYTHDGSETTSDSFTYRAKDSTTESNVATVWLTILPQNDPPTAVPDAYTVFEGGSRVEPAPGVLGNDTDVEGNPIVAEPWPFGAPSHGTLTLNADGSFRYTHDGSETTGDSFTYMAKNPGDIQFTLGIVTITVSPVNDAPVAAADDYAIGKGDTLAVPAPGVLGNDTDAEDDTLTAELVVHPSYPAHGTVALNADGSFTYTHDGSDTTCDLFTYLAYDGTDYSEATLVMIDITDIPGHTVSATVTVAGQIQTDDPWSHPWDKPMYYFWFDDNGNPNDGGYGNGAGPVSVNVRLDTGRLIWSWFGPDRTWGNADDVQYGPATESAPGEWDLGLGITASRAGDGTSLTVGWPLCLVEDPAALDVSFMASPWTTTALDNLGAGAYSTPAWITVDASVIGTTDQTDVAGDHGDWPGHLIPDHSTNFDITKGAVTIG